MASPLLYAQAPIGELNASPGSSVRGSLHLDGSGAKILSGSSLKAGDQPAELHLSRGGELRICPRSALAVSTPAPDSALLIGLNTGALEIECSPKAFTDVILTPDLRLQLTGPGSFHLALGVRPNGDTCVRMLAGGASSLIINENMGEGAYQPHSPVSSTTLASLRRAPPRRHWGRTIMSSSMRRSPTLATMSRWR